MTDEVRQEDRAKVTITDEDRAASDECCDYWLTRNATCNVDVEEMFARHATPLRDRIAVLEGALRDALDELDKTERRSAKRVMLARATLNGEKKDG